MSISAIDVGSHHGVNPVTASDTSAAKTPDTSNDNNADDATEAQPPVVAALPPGQGTRIDQIA